MYTLPLTVGDEQLEPPYHHVHHAAALRLLEQGRVRFLDEIGFPLQWFFDRRVLLVIADISIRYLREIRAGEVRVECDVPVIDGRRIVIPQRLFNERGKLAVEATVTSMGMDLDSRRGIAPPAEFAAACASMAAAGAVPPQN